MLNHSNLVIILQMINNLNHKKLLLIQIKLISEIIFFQEKINQD
jgi:hypothetical protein